MAYKIHLEKFEGPLDLLLYLIKKNDMDIYDIPIARITDQYMEYIEMMKILDLDVVGDFLVMAATLMQIKSKMLLPPDPLAPADAVDPRQELAGRLKEYEQFKSIAQEFKNKEIERQNLFPRVIDAQAMNDMKEDAREIFFEATLFDLINALSYALNHAPPKEDYQIQAATFTVEEKIHDLLHRLVANKRLSLKEIFGRASGKAEIICIFIAVLELIRLKEVLAVQHRPFEDIEILRHMDKEMVEPKWKNSNASF